MPTETGETLRLWELFIDFSPFHIEYIFIFVSIRRPTIDDGGIWFNNHSKIEEEEEEKESNDSKIQIVGNNQPSAVKS